MKIDWNDDGKQDWKDDEIMYHMVSESEKPEKDIKTTKQISIKPKQTTTQSDNKLPKEKDKVSGKGILAIISLIYISLMLSGSIPINSFNVIIGMGAIICLIICLIVG